MKKTILLSAFLALAAFSESKVALEISADASGTIPIGIVMFQPMEFYEPSHDAQPWRVIAANLDFTGDFSVKRLNTVDSAQLIENHIPIYITGTYKVENDTMVLEISLFDSGRHDLLLAKTYTFHVRDSRAVAHRYSTEVHRAILGSDSPYESRIVYVERTREETRNIVICDYDGQNKSYITKGGINIMPSFIDKYNVLCVSYDRGKPDIYSINLREGTKSAIVATRRVESSPNYSDIMGKVAFGSSKSGNMEIYTVDRDGENEQRLTVNPPAISTAPNWSPNGHRIVFVSDRTGSPQIYTMDRTGMDLRRITFGGSYHDSPAWSPDGSKIAYTAQRGGRSMIAVAGVDGNEEELITIDLSGTQEYPSWSPCGSHIIFTHRQGARTDISAIRLKDKKVTKLTDGGLAEQSKWSGY
jgi:TolB protein